MPARFWAKRFALAFVLATALLFLVEQFKGHALEQALQFALLWGTGSAALFTGIGYWRFRRNPACMRRPPQRV